MNDFPDYIALIPDAANVPMHWPGFPHTVTLLPDGMTIADVRAKPQAVAVFLIEPGSAHETLNGNALLRYIAARTPIVMHARRARDLRPFLRRSESFARRGYRVEIAA